MLAGVNEVIKILSDPIYREDVLAESLNEYGYKPRGGRMLVYSDYLYSGLSIYSVPQADLQTEKA